MTIAHTKLARIRLAMMRIMEERAIQLALAQETYGDDKEDVRSAHDMACLDVYRTIGELMLAMDDEFYDDDIQAAQETLDRERAAAKKIETKFYGFVNHGDLTGNYQIDTVKGIGREVWIEAVNPTHANERAEEIGIVFGLAWVRQSPNTEGWAKVSVNRTLNGGIRPFPVYVHTLDGKIHAFAGDSTQDFIEFVG